MTEEVVVTRKGQTTIPINLRRKYGITQGSRLEVEDTGKGILLKKVPSVIDMIGSGSKHATVEEVKRMLDEMRAEEDEG
jgi:AbrB family looped-hinge helix DNA binding protein